MWEQIETTATGQQVRKQYPVPKYFHHEDPTAWNYITDRDQAGRPVAGDIVVCYEGKGQPRDVIFTGPPTPDMTPQDEEAEKISRATFGERATNPEEMPDGGYAGRILEGLSQQLADAMASRATPAANPQMDKLVETMNKLIETQTALFTVMGNQVAEKSVRRGL